MQNWHTLEAQCTLLYPKLGHSNKQSYHATLAATLASPDHRPEVEAAGAQSRSFINKSDTCHTQPCIDHSALKMQMLQGIDGL